MQLNREIRYPETQQDVYAGVAPAFSATAVATQENQEFSMEAIREKLGLAASAAVEEQEITASSSDTMPSSQTINMTYMRQYSSSKTRVASKLTNRQKVMIASYAVVVLALIIGITLCSVYVNGAFSQALALDGQFGELSAQVAELTEQINSEDYDALMQRATELGYTEADKANTKRYTEVETRPAQNFEVKSNWFDSLCDWLCNAFGG